MLSRAQYSISLTLLIFFWSEPTWADIAPHIPQTGIKVPQPASVAIAGLAISAAVIVGGLVLTRRRSVLARRLLSTATRLQCLA